MNNFDLIINGIPITKFEPEDVICDFNNNSSHYCLDIEVERDSKADLLLKKMVEGKINEQL